MKVGVLQFFGWRDRSIPLQDVYARALERIDVGGSESLPIVTNGMPEVWMILSGAVRIQTSGLGTVDVVRGTTVLMPARISDAAAMADRPATILRITLPSPIKGLLA